MALEQTGMVRCAKELPRYDKGQEKFFAALEHCKDAESYERLAALEKISLVRLRLAFWYDTKDRNRRAVCQSVGVKYIREMVKDFPPIPV